MKIKDIMNKNMVSVKPTATVKEVFKTMQKYNTSGLPVIDEHGNLVGFIPESSLLVRGKSFGAIKEHEKHSVHFDYHEFVSQEKRLHGATAADIMNKEVLTVDENDDILEVVDIMLSKKVSRMPVMRHKKVVGFITRADVIKAIMDMEEEMEITGEEAEVTDDIINHRVIEALRKNLGVALLNVRVKTHNGVVHLQGQVPAAHDTKAAGEIAASVHGVKNVDNELIIERLLD